MEQDLNKESLLRLIEEAFKEVNHDLIPVMEQINMLGLLQPNIEKVLGLLAKLEQYSYLHALFFTGQYVVYDKKQEIFVRLLDLLNMLNDEKPCSRLTLEQAFIVSRMKKDAVEKLVNILKLTN